MFDPSKLDLDLDNKEEKKDQPLKTTSKNETKDEDILVNLNSEENTNTEKKELIIEDINKTKNEDILVTLDSNENINTDILKQLSTEEKKEKIINEEEIGKTEYEKSIEKKVVNNISDENNNQNKIIFDINITSIQILLSILIEKEYDFATFEPTEEAVKIDFRKDKVIKDTKYIKFPVYTEILLKAKAITKLTIEETQKEQEGVGETIIKNNNYKITTKVVPSSLGSKLFIKAAFVEKKLEKIVAKKTSLSDIFTFLGAIAFISLIIGGGFIGFIVLNAKTIDDVKFFYSLGINLNDINNFISQVISIIFSILVFIETIFLIIYLFKFSLTKKEFKQTKIRYGIIGTVIFFITFFTGSAWMVINQKISTLPNWQEVAFGDVQIYDNAKLISESFDKQGALLEKEQTSNLIGPVEIKFDLSFYAKKEEQKGLKIKKFIWDFGNGVIEETPTPTIIHKFSEKGNYEVKLTIEELDLQNQLIEKIVENVPNINISYVVNVNEKKLTNGGKLVDFDASSLSELGKVQWYFMDNLNEPVWEGEVFRMGKPIFEETLVGMYIKRNDKESEVLDKVFIISGEEETSLDGKITYTRGIINDLEYDFKLENISNDFGNGYIEEYKWKIGTKEITKQGDITNPEESSAIKYTFDTYGDHKVSVTIKDSAGETKEISTTINIPKNLKLKNPLRFSNENTLLEDVKYDNTVNEYYLNEIGVPTNLKFDARFLKADNLLYTLKKVDWDYNSDGDIDESTKTGKYELNTEGNHTITVYYEFAHRKIANDTIKVKEQIFIEGLKKEAIIDFVINKDSDYIPVTVGFDASTSQVKDENIEKFIWNYGDGVTEERDSIVQGHKYSTPGDYNIKLEVITTSGKSFTTTKKLILKPKPQSVKITTSMKKAPIGQGIDFSSGDSEGQITGYFWDFGDGSISTEANPTHTFYKEGKYSVNLKIDFSNKNVLEDKIEIEVYEE